MGVPYFDFLSVTCLIVQGIPLCAWFTGAYLLYNFHSIETKHVRYCMDILGKFLLVSSDFTYSMVTVLRGLTYHVLMDCICLVYLSC